MTNHEDHREAQQAARTIVEKIMARSPRTSAEAVRDTVAAYADAAIADMVREGKIRAAGTFPAIGNESAKAAIQAA